MVLQESLGVFRDFRGSVDDDETDTAEMKMSFNSNGTTFTFTGGTLDRAGMYLEPTDRMVYSVPL